MGFGDIGRRTRKPEWDLLQQLEIFKAALLEKSPELGIAGRPQPGKEALKLPGLPGPPGRAGKGNLEKAKPSLSIGQQPPALEKASKLGLNAAPTDYFRKPGAFDPRALNFAARALNFKALNF